MSSKEIIIPNPFSPILAKMNLTSHKIEGPLSALKDRSGLSKVRIRGHLIHGPTNEQVYDKYNAMLNQARITQWVIMDESDSLLDSDNGKWKQRSLSQIDMIVVHTTDSNTWNYYDVFAYDTSSNNHITPGKGLPGITYHMMLSKNGDMYLTSRFSNITYHAGGYNSRSVSIAIPYRATGATQPPLSSIMRGLVRALTILTLRFKFDPYKAIKGHRELLGTGFRFVKGHKVLRKTCPGLLVDLDHLRLEVAIEIQKILQRVSITNSHYVDDGLFSDRKLYDGPIDGIIGPKTRKAIKNFYSEALDLLLNSNTPKDFIGDKEWDEDKHKYKYGV